VLPQLPRGGGCRGGSGGAPAHSGGGEPFTLLPCAPTSFTIYLF
jgi:hypothetical protein